MMKSITGTVTFALTVAFAIPVGLLGLEFLVSGETFLGVVFVVFAVLMVVVEEYITSPTDLPGIAIRRVVGTVVKTDADVDTDTDTNTNDETGRQRERS